MILKHILSKRGFYNGLRFFKRAIQNPLKCLQGFRNINLDKLKFLWVEITSRCNLRCRSCSKFYGLDGPYEDMEIELFDLIAKMFFDKIETLSITGIGEPLYHNNIRKIFDILETYPNLKLDFVSNGQLWDEYWLERIGRFKSNLL